MKPEDIKAGNRYRDAAQSAWEVDSINGQRVTASKLAPDDCSWVQIELSLGRFASMVTTHEQAAAAS